MKGSQEFSLKSYGRIMVPAMVICMLLLTAIYPDAFRINDLDVSRSPAVGQAADAPSGGAGH